MRSIPLTIVAVFALFVAAGPARGASNLVTVSVSPPAFAGDCDSLEVSGFVDVEIKNDSLEDVVATFEVLAFEDLDGDHLYSPTDQLLGFADVAPPLVAGASTSVPITVTGTLQFRDAPIHAWADSAEVEAEEDETDNIADTGEGCQRSPVTSDFELVVEWEWRQDDVATAPLVGDVNADGTPDVLFAAIPGYLVCLDGRTGEEHWRTEGAPVAVSGEGTPAIGELDGDPGLEVVVISGSEMAMFDDDGSFVWRSAGLGTPLVRGTGAVALADLDCDGSPEAILQNGVCRTTDGSRYWWPIPVGGTIGANSGYNGISTAADVNDDGVLEVVAGPTAWILDPDPTNDWAMPLWNQPDVGDGYTAIGQFDADPGPEIVLVQAGRLALLEGEDGAIIWDVPIPVGGSTCVPPLSLGGPPTIADVDGDGEPEIGIADSEWYHVFETDGSLKWQAPSHDCSSASTGSTVFDFDGDGSAEIVYQDERNLHIYRGVDGFELASIPTSSGTIQEMPTIADVDGDGRAEIVAGMTTWEGSFLKGLRVYGDANDNWVNARRIWNQHSYHVSNVNDDGTIPALGTGACEEESWLAHATYRLQLPPEQSPLGLADVTLTILDSWTQPAPICGNELIVEARVGNGGAISTGRPIDVWIHLGDPAAGGRPLQSVPIPMLAPGEWWPISLTVPLREAGTFYLIADDDGTGAGFVSECREDNNTCTIPLPVLPPAPRLPEPVGASLRATGHGDPHAASITATFSWITDEGLPRPDGEHYHVQRGTRPDTLSLLPSGHPWTQLTWLDATPASPTKPACHYVRVLAADLCEQEEQR